jgi:hypothetical protein
MAVYFAVHTQTNDPKKFNAHFAAVAMPIATAMATGKTPAKCIKTWNPGGYGRVDYLFCLWEAEKPADIEATLREYGFMDYLTLDAMKVDEVDWAQMAKASVK